MKKKITDALLAEAATRNFHGETLESIAASLDIPVNSLISAKNRRSGEWRQAIDAARHAIAEAPIAALKRENAELKSRNATLETENKAMRAELQAIKIENKEIREQHRKQALYHHQRRKL